MKIGYPCINNRIGCTANKTFRLASYSEERLKKTIKANLECLQKILEYNVSKGMLFFRIGSPLVPFASHPVCKFNWQNHFKKEFKKIGNYIKKNKMRISMHPDQFVLINALKKSIVKKSIKELAYHCQVLDLLELDASAKVQIHVGGVYENKEKSIKRFVKEYKKLPTFIKKRLAIENDHHMYSLKDCFYIHKKIGIPIIFDSFHHECYNNGESLKQAINLANKTWKKKDGCLMIDYSNQKKGERKGTHTENINIKKFTEFIKETKALNLDIMLEIKDKEKSALKAIKILKEVI